MTSGSGSPTASLKAAHEILGGVSARLGICEYTLNGDGLSPWLNRQKYEI